MAKVTKESVYEEIREKGHEGKTLRSEEKKSFCQTLLREGKIKKVGKRYYSPEFAPTAEMVYRKVKEAGEDGASLKTVEKELVKPLIQEGKVKYVYKKYYLSKFSPLKQKEVVERLLSGGKLKRLGKTYFIFIEDTFGPPPPPVEIPSFLEFAKRVQDIYLRMAGEYRQSVKIMPLIEELISKMNIPRIVAEKWILELPRIFLGRVDLRPFPGERGLKMEDDSEVARIYLERGIVGL